jgi:hypothetical protein
MAVFSGSCGMDSHDSSSPNFLWIAFLCLGDLGTATDRFAALFAPCVGDLNAVGRGLGRSNGCVDTTVVGVVCLRLMCWVRSPFCLNDASHSAH